MHCYRDGSCFYYCESTFNIVIFYLLLNRCKFTLNCYFCFLAFLFRFQSCHAHLNILWNLRIINVLLLFIKNFGGCNQRNSPLLPALYGVHEV